MFRRVTFLLFALSMLVVTAQVISPACFGQRERFKPDNLPSVINDVQRKMVKIYGAGGLSRLEAYQSGILVSADGLILTVWSYVLDSDVVAVVLNDGTRHDAKLVGFHPQLEIALLKIELADNEHFNLDTPTSVTTGTGILAFSNLYGVATGNEQVSVQRGVVAALTKLSGRRGAMQTAYKGPVLMLDAITSNPGSAGGAVTDRRGRLLGLVGKELRSDRNSVWLNFALPVSELSVGVDEILAGQTRASTVDQQKPSEPISLSLVGLGLVPNVVARTPPFVDRVTRGSSADRAGIQPDDLIVEIDGQIVGSVSEVLEKLSMIDRDRDVPITLQRGQEFLKVTVSAN